MTRNEFDQIFESKDAEWEGDNAFQGLQIIAKYFDPATETIICASEHDVLYSVNVDEILEKGLTKEDAAELRRLNWMEENDTLACFV